MYIYHIYVHVSKFSKMVNIPKCVDGGVLYPDKVVVFLGGSTME